MLNLTFGLASRNTVQFVDCGTVRCTVISALNAIDLFIVSAITLAKKDRFWVSEVA